MAKLGGTKFTWVIKNFCSLQSETDYFRAFEIGDAVCNCRLSAVPHANKPEFLSLHTLIAYDPSLPPKRRRYVRYRLTLVNQISEKLFITQEGPQWFDDSETLEWGSTSVFYLPKLGDKVGGFLVHDEVEIVAEVDVFEVTDNLDIPEEFGETVRPPCKIEENNGAYSSFSLKESSTIKESVHVGQTEETLAGGEDSSSGTSGDEIKPTLPLGSGEISQVSIPPANSQATGENNQIPPAAAVKQEVPAVELDVTEAELKLMWNQINSADVTGIDSDAFRIFEYQGFSLDAILKSLLIAKKKNSISQSVFINDIFVLCSLAIIKGSINDKNFRKVSVEGQREIAKLEQRYGIKRGSGRGEPPHVITIPRIAAAFPGKIIQLIAQGKVNARKLFGPLKSHTLPAVMRHQAFAAVIPSLLSEAVKEFLLCLVTAFSVDLSICINPDKKTKPDVAGVFYSQRGFIQITTDSRHPPDPVRISIFKSIVLNYDDLLTCATSLQELFPTFKIIDRDEFVRSVGSL